MNGDFSVPLGSVFPAMSRLTVLTPVSARLFAWGWYAEEIRWWTPQPARARARARARDYVCEGIRWGFRIGFDYGLCQCTRALRNMKSVSEHKEVVEEYIRGEVEAGRVMGPFSREAFPGVQVSPFGVIPKSEPGKWRLIIDLSAPKGSSVNDGIDPALCSLAYLSVDLVMRRVRVAGQGALLAKFDLKSAYRNVPVHPNDRWLLGMLWDDQLFVDSVLPFGLRSAPKIFTAVASMLAYVIRKRDVCWLDHYLDDFVLVGPPRSPVCQRSLGKALEVCRASSEKIGQIERVGEAW